MATLPEMDFQDNNGVEAVSVSVGVGWQFEAHASRL